MLTVRRQLLLTTPAAQYGFTALEWDMYMYKLRSQLVVSQHSRN